MAVATLDRLAMASLADALLEEFERKGIVFARTQPLGPDYDPSSCATLAQELGDGPLSASETLYTALVKDGEIGATKLAKKLNVARTPTIAFVLTTPLKRVSTRLGLAWPFDVATGSDGRTVWRDRDGIAAMMLDAIRVEKKRRGL